MTISMKDVLRPSMVIALAAIAAGCQDTSGPGSLGRLNAAAALADYKAMDDVRQTAGWRGFKMAAAQMNAALSVSVVTAAGDRAASVPLISTANRGKTFVYNAQQHDWVIDPARTGAPANGVRFITYEPKGEEPDATKPIGHADLIDLGDNSAGIALRLVVVEGSLTILDYKTTVEGTDGSGHVTVEGFLQNNRDKLDFDIDVKGQNSGGVEQGDIAFDLGIASREFRVHGDVGVEKQNGEESGTLDLKVKHGASSFDVDITNQFGTLSGAIDLNSNPFVEVSGPAQQPVFRTPTGGDIGGNEALVIWRIFDVSEDVFDLFEDLIDPIDELVFLAFVL